MMQSNGTKEDKNILPVLRVSSQFLVPPGTATAAARM
jgi:hypothetical protein